MASFLDADLATVGRSLRAGVAWWLDELRDMLPARVSQRDRRLRAYAAWDGGETLHQIGRRDAAPIVLVAPHLCLLRELELPPLGKTDLEQMVRLDADRILPVPAARLVLAVEVDRLRPGHVTVAGLPLERAAQLAQVLADCGIAPRVVAVADPDNPDVAAADLTPALHAAGLLAPHGAAARNWWLLAATLLVLNGALLIWRDLDRVAQLETLVAQQEPAVVAARSIAARIAAMQRQSVEVAQLRDGPNALSVLADTSQALPDGTWLNRYAWSGRTLRIAGFKREGVDVVASFRKAGSFRNVRSQSGEADAEVLTGQPFELDLGIVGASQ